MTTREAATRGERASRANERASAHGSQVEDQTNAGPVCHSPDSDVACNRKNERRKTQEIGERGGSGRVEVDRQEHNSPQRGAHLHRGGAEHRQHTRRGGKRFESATNTDREQGSLTFCTKAEMKDEGSEMNTVSQHGSRGPQRRLPARPPVDRLLTPDSACRHHPTRTDTLAESQQTGQSAISIVDGKNGRGEKEILRRAL